MPDPITDQPEWHEDPNVISWDWREQPDLDQLGALLARHGVTMTEVDTGTDDVAIRIGSAPMEVLEDAVCRRVWAAACRWLANQCRSLRVEVARDLDEVADQIERGDLTPWADTCEECGGSGSVEDADTWGDTTKPCRACSAPEETAEEVLAAYERGQKGVTAPPPPRVEATGVTLTENATTTTQGPEPAVRAILAESREREIRQLRQQYPALPVTRCGQRSVHAVHMSDVGPDQPRVCPGVSPYDTLPDWTKEPEPATAPAGAAATPAAVDEPAGSRLIDIAEFRRHGYLQEVNRQFLHPLGLALAVHVADDGTESLSGVWDDRDDPEGIRYAPDVIDPEKAARVLDAQRRMGDSRLAVLGYVMQPADPDPHPDTPPHASGILGRALLASDRLFLAYAPGQWTRKPAEHWRTDEVADHYGPVREVLLVDPAAWERRGQVILAALARVAHIHESSRHPRGVQPEVWADEDEMALIAAVDALTGGPEQALRELARREAETLTEPAVIRIADGVHWLGEVASDAQTDPEPGTVESRRAAADFGETQPSEVTRPAEPTPEPAGDGPGWDRPCIEAAENILRRGGKAPGLADQLTALLADRDRQGLRRVHAEGDLRRAGEQLDQVTEQLDECYRAMTEAQQHRDAARAEMAEKSDRADEAQQRVDRLLIELGQGDATPILAGINPTWDGTCDCEDKSMHSTDCRQGHGTACDEDCSSRWGCPRLLRHALFTARAEMATMQQRWQQAMEDGDEQTVTRLRLHAELAEVTAERDRCRELLAWSMDRAATLEWAADGGMLRQWAAEIRTGQRDTPGTEAGEHG